MVWQLLILHMGLSVLKSGYLKVRLWSMILWLMKEGRQNRQKVTGLALDVLEEIKGQQDAATKKNKI